MHGWARRARLLAGLLLLGQGGLVVTGVLDHEAPYLVGATLVAVGTALVAWGKLPAPAPHEAPAAGTRARARLVAASGLAAALATLGYNALARSNLALPEIAIVAYGALLVAAAPHLDRRVGSRGGARVGTLVAWSLPLVAAPLAVYAANAAVVAQVGARPLDAYVRWTLVQPMSWLLAGSGLDARTLGETVRVGTPRGPLYLTVGVVCAGIYATIVFLGVFALYAWQQNLAGPRLAAYLALGVVGLHVANVLRLALLGYVGYRWGAEALVLAHRHAGWVLFIAWTMLFWWLVLRRFEPRWAPVPSPRELPRRIP